MRVKFLILTSILKLKWQFIIYQAKNQWGIISFSKSREHYLTCMFS